MANPATRSYRSALSRARGLGAAKDGTAHWWAERVTSVALVPLTLWFAFAVVSLNGAGYEEVRAWLAQPWVAIGTLLLLLATFYHAALGCQVILEDYVDSYGWRIASILAVKSLCFVLGVASTFAVAKIAFTVSV